VWGETGPDPADARDLKIKETRNNEIKKRKNIDQAKKSQFLIMIHHTSVAHLWNLEDLKIPKQKNKGKLHN
jgi:hypothetical protein